MTALLVAAILATTIDAPQQAKRYELTASQWNRLAEAHSFVVGQECSLALIKRDFPDLTREVTKASMGFEASALGEGHRGVQKILSERFGDEWSNFDATLTKQLEAEIDNQVITRDDAIRFLAEVKARASGKIPDKFRATLLAFNPKYLKNPAREFIDGWTQTFESNGHPKSKGANFKFSYPASWTAAEGDRPNVIKKFRSEGFGFQTAGIVTKKLPLNDGTTLTEQDQFKLLSPEMLQSFLPPRATFIDAQTTRIDGNPAGILEYKMFGERAGIRFPMCAWTVYFIVGDTLVHIQFATSSPPGSETDAANRMNEFRPLYSLMASSVVLTDKWTDAAR
jgi:hypothetical protein